MKAIRIVISILAIVLALAAGALVAIAYDDPVSIGCMRACWHVDGPGYVDCVLMCESYR